MRSGRLLAAGWGVVVVAGLVALVLAALGDRRATAFSDQIAPGSAAVTLSRSKQVCQGPIPVQSTVGAVTVRALGAPPPGTRLQLAVGAAGVTPSPHGGSPPAPAQQRATMIAVGDGGGSLPSFKATLAHPVTGGSLTLCLSTADPGPVVLAGGEVAPGQGLVIVTRGGRRRSSTGLTLLFEMPHPPSLLSALPLAFHRAALFHPGWVGAWTFWVLLAALLIAALGVLRGALRAAAAAAAAEAP